MSLCFPSPASLQRRGAVGACWALRFACWCGSGDPAVLESDPRATPFREFRLALIPFVKDVLQEKSAKISILRCVREQGIKWASFTCRFLFYFLVFAGVASHEIDLRQHYFFFSARGRFDDFSAPSYSKPYRWCSCCCSWFHLNFLHSLFLPFSLFRQTKKICPHFLFLFTIHGLIIC